MKLFKILIFNKPKVIHGCGEVVGIASKPRHHISHWQVIDSVPPVCVEITPGLYSYSGGMYVIDIDYQPPVTDPKNLFIIYKGLLTKRLRDENYL